MIKLKSCDVYCLYSHLPKNKRGAEPAPNISECNYSNINNHFYLIGEYDLGEYFTSAAHDTGRITEDVDEVLPPTHINSEVKHNHRNMYKTSRPEKIPGRTEDTDALGRLLLQHTHHEAPGLSRYYRGPRPLNYRNTGYIYSM